MEHDGAVGMKHLLVVGASSFIGGEIYRQAEEQGIHVIGTIPHGFPLIWQKMISPMSLPSVD